MPVRDVLPTPNVPIKIWTKDIEPEAQQQLWNTAQLPFVHRHVAAMPDVHWGMGATVGSVIATKKAIVPAAVGVDIGCGMAAVQLSGVTASHLPDSLGGIRSALEAVIPHGRTDNGGKNDRGAWSELPEANAQTWAELMEFASLQRVLVNHPQLLKHGLNSYGRHLGTLGTGNHFVELCVDKHDGVWLMLHSGSRGIGNRIGTYFIEQAKKEMERWHIQLPDPDLAYLPEGTDLFDDYWSALSWAQVFAERNRALMMQAALSAVAVELGRDVFDLTVANPAINCHHNYATLETHYGEHVYVTRKGAVRAREGDLGIIPGSMGARSFIVRGKGNPESFCSCSHGAGRKMSRGAAKKLFTVADLEAQTAGVECRKDADVIDEIPGAYKDIQTVMDNQSDLVEIVAELKQVVCVKG
jgi:tRNA-splicing ligase RtcB